MNRAEEIERAKTVPLPGGVKLNPSEERLRGGTWLAPSVELRAARSILAKVAAAVTGEGT